MAKTALTRKQRMLEFPQGYSISVTGRHMHVTDAMKAYAEEKLDKIERIGDRIINITVTMDIQKLAHNVEIVMKYGHALFRSSAASTNMYVSIDQAIDKLQRQLKKYKRQQKAHHGKEYPVVQAPVKIERPLSPEAFTSLSEIDEQEINETLDTQEWYEMQSWAQPHEIVKVESQSLFILSDDEAIRKVERSKRPLLVYRDEKTRKLKVIYRQNDGNYGVVESD